MRHWRARLCAGARARTRHRIFLRDTRIDARRSATDIPTNAHTPTRPFSLPILSPSIPFASLSPSLSLCIPTFLRSRVSRVHRGIVRTYVRTKRGREGKSQRERERRLTLESTIGERVCARVVDDAPRTRVKSRGEGIPAPPSSPSRRPPRLSPSLLPSILVLLSSRCTRSPPNLPPRRHLARARRAYTPPAARGAVSRVAAGGARRRRG